MLSIKIGKYFADLSPDIAIELNFINPMFADNGFPIGFTYSWTLPNTPGNAKIFSNYKENEVSVSLIYAGARFVSGIGRVKSSYNSFTIEVRSEYGSIVDKLKASNLQELIDDFPTYKIYDEEDSAFVKLQKWEQHAMDVLTGEHEGSEFYCFPPLGLRREETELKSTILSHSHWSSTTETGAQQTINFANNAFEDKYFFANLFYNGAYHFVENIKWNPAKQWKDLTYWVNPITEQRIWYMSSEGEFGETPDDVLPWNTSVSACLWISALVKKISEKLDLKIKISEFNKIEYFNTLYALSGLYYDEVEEVEWQWNGEEWELLTTTDPVNIFKKELNANDFIPRIPALDVLKSLYDSLGIYYSFNGSELVPRQIKKQLLHSPREMSKFVEPNFEMQTYRSKQFISFPVDLDEEDRLFWNINFDLITGGFDGVANIPMLPFELGTGQEDSYQMSHLLMNDKVIVYESFNYIPIFYYSVPGLFGGYFLEQVNAFKSEIVVNHAGYFFSSTELDEEPETIDKLCIGTLRGLKFKLYSVENEMDYEYYYNDSNPEQPHPVAVVPTSPPAKTAHEYTEQPIFSNRKNIELALLADELTGTAYEGEGERTINLGNSTLFPQWEDSLFAENLKPLLELLANNSEIKKTLFLPLFEILELLKWEQVTHVIRQEKMSFKGVVKEFSFTLFKNNISPCSVTYLSQNKSN